jgi:hypothetical protein
MGMRNMTERLGETPRDGFVEAAQREMIAFERKEQELRQQEKLERAKQLQIPLKALEL